MTAPLTPSLSPSEGERVPAGRLRGIPTGSWLRFTSEFWRCSLPMNPEEHPTTNIQRRTSNGSANPRSLRRSVFEVGCSMFSPGSGAAELLALFLILAMASNPALAAERRPNILIVLADQWRAQAFGFAG